MRWFNRGVQKEVWEEDIDWPLGDLEAANRIRAICSAASTSAEKMSARAGVPQDKHNGRETERYERAARTAMEIAMKISDDLVRDAAVRQIIGLCMMANNLKTAEILLRVIHAEAFREEVLREHPQLRR
jgi:predicted Mrr-cat superfamily restriction endonuclease